LELWFNERFRPAIYQSGAVVLGLLVIIPMFAADQTINSSSPQVRQIFVRSAKLRKLLDEVKPYGYVDVPITQDLSSTDASQGYSKPKSTPRGMVYDVHVSQGSDIFVENVIAHELLHAALRHERLGSGSGTILRGRELSANDLAAMQGLIMSLTNCYQDAIIDRRMAKLGFNPQLLQDDEKSTLIAEANVVPRTSLYKRDATLMLYCLSIRLRKFEMDEIYTAYKSWYPELAQDVQTVSNTVGPDLCDTEESCFKKMLALRKAVGLEGEVKFINPTTNRKE
jgi:hypothetical protein